MKKLRKISPEKLDAVSSSGQDRSHSDPNMYTPGPPYPFTPVFDQYTPIGPVPYTPLPPVTFSPVPFTNTPAFKISPGEMTYGFTF